MQGRLITSVLVPAQTQPKRKTLSEQEEAAVVGGLFGFVILVVLAMAFTMRQSKTREEQAKQAEESALAKQFEQKYSQSSADKSTESSGDQDELEAAAASADEAAEERKKLRVEMAESWERTNIEKIKEHKYALFEEYNNGISVDVEYGIIRRYDVVCGTCKCS